MNYAEQSRRYYELAEQEELAANWRKDQIIHQEQSRLENMRQWNPLMRDNVRFRAYLEARISAAVERDEEYKSHIGMQQHYLRKSDAAANQAYLHGHTLVFESELEDGASE